MDVVVLGTNWTSGNAFTILFCKRGPPGEALKEGNGAVDPRVTGEPNVALVTSVRSRVLQRVNLEGPFRGPVLFNDPP